MDATHLQTKKEIDRVLDDYFNYMGSALSLSRRVKDDPENRELERRYKLTVNLLQEKLNTLESYVLQLKFHQRQF